MCLFIIPDEIYLYIDETTVRVCVRRIVFSRKQYIFGIITESVRTKNKKKKNHISSSDKTHVIGKPIPCGLLRIVCLSTRLYNIYRIRQKKKMFRRVKKFHRENRDRVTLRVILYGVW